MVFCPKKKRYSLVVMTGFTIIISCSIPLLLHERTCVWAHCIWTTFCVSVMFSKKSKFNVFELEIYIFLPFNFYIIFFCWRHKDKWILGSIERTLKMIRFSLFYTAGSLSLSSLLKIIWFGWKHVVYDRDIFYVRILFW